MSIDPVRWGILGTAAINRKLLGGAAHVDDLEILAVASRDADRAREYAAEHAIPRAYGSYEALLEDPHIEAVYISLPNLLHHRWTVSALEAGKHVLCEKPYSRRPDEVAVAFDLAERRGLVLMEAFMWRHTPQTARLLELLPEIGDLQTIRASFNFPMATDVDIRLEPALDGGALMDVGCYCVSGARLLTGEEPARVSGEAVAGPSGVDVRFAGVLRFPSGVLAELSCGFTTDHRGLEAIGTTGTLAVADPWQAVAGRVILNGRAVDTAPTDPYGAELVNVIAAIRGSAAPRLGRADAIGQARTIAALYESAAEGRTISLD